MAGFRALALALAIAGAHTSSAAAAPLPPQGIYQGCSPGTTAAELEACTDELAVLRAAGFTIVLAQNGLYATPANARAYAAEASRLGVRIIWPLHHRNLYNGTADLSRTYPQMTAACSCSDAAHLIPFMVGVVKSSRATFLYYIGDETPDELHAGMSRTAAIVRAADPAHDRLFVGTAGQDAAAFAGDAETIALDTYPIGLSGDVGEVRDTAARVRSAADRTGRRAAIVLQSFSWGPTYDASRLERWPTVGEYAAMRDEAIAAGRPDFILWWAYYTVQRSSSPALRWRELVAGAFAPTAAAAQAPPAEGPPTYPGQAPAGELVRSAVRLGYRFWRHRHAKPCANPTVLVADSLRDTDGNAGARASMPYCTVWTSRTHVRDARRELRPNRGGDSLEALCTGEVHEVGHLAGLEHSAAGVMAASDAETPWACERWANAQRRHADARRRHRSHRARALARERRAIRRARASA